MLPALPLADRADWPASPGSNYTFCGLRETGVPMGFATNAIHVGQEPDPATGAVVAPIYQTSTYVQTELGKDKGYDYARTNHPNRKALERTVAKLEGGQSAYVFSSGMAGIDAVFRLDRKST